MRRHHGFRWLAWVGLVVGGACGPSTTHTAPVGCVTNRDCTGAKVCAFGQCHLACRSLDNCASGQWCVQDGEEAACVDKDAPCDRQADCAPPLVCATDHRCRNRCTASRDCAAFGILGRVCANDDNDVGVCASASETDERRLSTTPAPGSDGGRVEPPVSSIDDSGGFGSLLPVAGTANVAGSVGRGGNVSGGAATVGSAGRAGVSGSGGASGGGKGGSGGAGGGPLVASVCDGKTYALPLAEAYIDDFETTARFGAWYAFADTSPPAAPFTRVAGGALLTGFAGRATATGIKSPTMQGYGAGFGFGLVDPARGECLDVSAFDGISFWAKGSAGVDSTLKFQIVVPESEPSDAMPQGDCAPLSGCDLHPAKTIALGAGWTHYTLPFAELTSPKFAWVSRRVLGMNFITSGPSYDVSVDELTFYVGVAPTGPVSPPSGEGGGAF